MSSHSRFVVVITTSILAVFLILLATHLTLVSIDSQTAATSQALSNILANLKTLNFAKQGSVNGGTTSGVTTYNIISTFNFTRTLKIGSTGVDVKNLQILLNSDPATLVAKTGIGSSGHESICFGPATASAVSKFQLKYKAEILTANHLTSPTGSVGTATLKKLNSLLTLARSNKSPILTTTISTNNLNKIISTNVGVSQNQNTSGSGGGRSSSGSGGSGGTSGGSSSGGSSQPSCTAPSITSALTSSATVSSSFSYTITASNSPTTYTATNLPTGLSFSSPTISGTPTTAATTNITITVTNSCGTDSKTLVLTTSVNISSPGAILTPGTGFTGATPQPANQGSIASPVNGVTYSQYENAIARWDVVPYQTFSGNFNVGVVAFHSSGIAKVSFSVNGGPWTDVSQMTANPQTANTSGVGNPNPNGVVEYWTTLRASDFTTDGPIEVRAIAYPNVGIPRVLESLPLNANSNGTLTRTPIYISPAGSDSTGDGTQGNPFATIYKAGMSIQSVAGSADNGVIYLLPGDYEWAGAGWNWHFPVNTYGWLTVTAAPGVDRSQVRITSMKYWSPTDGSDSRIDTHLVHISNVTLTIPIGQLDHNSPLIWYDGCEYLNLINDPTTPPWNSDYPYADRMGSGLAYWNGGSYATDCNVTGADNAIRGFVFSRNNTASHLGEDAFSDSTLVINSVASDMAMGWYQNNDGTWENAHPDVIQNGGGGHNTIWYGVVAVDNIHGTQGLSGGGETDMAIVNCHMATDGHQFYMDARNGNLTNVYLKSDIFSGTGGFYWSLPSAYSPMTGCQDVVVEDSWFDVARTTSVGSLVGAYPGVTYMNNVISSNVSNKQNFLASVGSLAQSIQNFFAWIFQYQK